MDWVTVLLMYTFIFGFICVLFAILEAICSYYFLGRFFNLGFIVHKQIIVIDEDDLVFQDDCVVTKSTGRFKFSNNKISFLAKYSFFSPAFPLKSMEIFLEKRFI